MTVSWPPNTSHGRMFGDYISTSVLPGGPAFPVIPVANTPSGGLFDLACAVSMINASTRTAAADAPAAQNDTANPCLDRREAEQIRRYGAPNPQRRDGLPRRG